MKILINAANVRFGGGVTVAKNIINSIISRDNGEYILLLPQNAGYAFRETDNLRIIYIEDKFHFNLLYKMWFVRFGFSRMVKETGAGFVFSLGNVAFPCKVPHLVLIQNAYLFYPESVLWKRLRFKFRLYVKMANIQTAHYLKFADGFFVQTDVMRERLHRLFGIDLEKIRLLPNVVSYQSKPEVIPDGFIRKPGEPVKLLFLSKYYPHKNLDILLPLAEMIKESGSPVSISVTVSPDEHPDLVAMHQVLVQKDLTGIIRMIGAIDPEAIHEAFREHHGSILPSLLESFSGTYIESMFYGKPVFTSDLDFAHTVCKDAAFYFDPLDAGDILKCITEAFNRPDKIREKIAKGYEIVEMLPGWGDLSRMILHTIREMKEAPGIK